MSRDIAQSLTEFKYKENLIVFFSIVARLRKNVPKLMQASKNIHKFLENITNVYGTEPEKFMSM